MRSTRGIALQAGKFYRLFVGGAVVYVEDVKAFPDGPMGVILPEQEADVYAQGIPGSTKQRSLGCFSQGDEVQPTAYNKKFVQDLPALRRAGTATVPPPRPSKAGAGARTKVRSSSGSSATFSHVKDNPAFRPGSQPGFVQAALKRMDKPTKQQIADAIAKDPGWKWSADAALKAARWYTEVLVREGFAKEN